MIGYQSSRRKQPRTPQDRYHARKRKRELAALPLRERLKVETIFSRENLFLAAFDLVRMNGHAPGRDQVRPEQLTPSEIGDISQAVSASILAGTYRPHKTRPCDIPKPLSEEKRTLQIGCFFDRVVAKALHDSISPYVEGCFHTMSFGFRPGRSAWEMLAELKVASEAEDTWVLVNVDIRKAFDRVVIDDVLQAHRELFQQHAEQLGDHTPLLKLVETVLRGHDPHRQIGIDQGSPYSPTALNIHLHLNHDVPINRDSIKPFWVREDHEQSRYADNLVYRAQSVKEGTQVLEYARRLLKSRQLELKGEGGVYDLRRGHNTPLLGFVLGKDQKEMLFELGPEALVRLRQHLLETHESPDPVRQARLALRGWAASMGPAFPRSRDACSAIGSLVADLGLREAYSRLEFSQAWEESWVRWCLLVGQATSGYTRVYGDLRR